MKFVKWANSHTWIYTVAIISFVIIPVAVQFVPVFYGEHSMHGDWLGFWGSYLGIVPSGIIAYMVASAQIKAQRDDTQYMEYTAKRVAFNIDIVKKPNGKKYILVENMSNCNANFVQILLNVGIKSKKNYDLCIGMAEACENETCSGSRKGEFRKLSLAGKCYTTKKRKLDDSKMIIPIHFNKLNNISIYYQSELRETVKITYLVFGNEKIEFVNGYNSKQIKNIKERIGECKSNADNLSLLNCPEFLTYMERKPYDDERHKWVFEHMYSYNGFREKLK